MASRAFLGKDLFPTVQAVKKLAWGQGSGFSLFSNRHALQGQSGDGARSLSSVALSKKIHWRGSSGSFCSDGNLPRVIGSLERTTFCSYQARGYRTVGRIQKLSADEVQRFVGMHPGSYEPRLVSSAPHAVGDPVPQGFSLVAVPRPGSDAEILANELDEQFVEGTVHLGFVGLVRIPLRAVELTMCQLLETTYGLDRHQLNRHLRMILYHMPEMKKFDYDQLKRRFPQPKLKRGEARMRRDKARKKLDELRLQGGHNGTRSFTEQEAIDLARWLFVLAVDDVFYGNDRIRIAVENCVAKSTALVVTRDFFSHCFEEALKSVCNILEFKPGPVATRTFELFKQMKESERVPHIIRQYISTFDFCLEFVKSVWRKVEP